MNKTEKLASDLYDVVRCAVNRSKTSESIFVGRWQTTRRPLRDGFIVLANYISDNFVEKSKTELYDVNYKGKCSKCGLMITSSIRHRKYCKLNKKGG